MDQRDFIHRVLAVRSSDPILHHIAPLGLAAAAQRCLVIDLDQKAPAHSEHTLRDLVHDGLRATDLESRPGPAVLSNGGISFADAAPVIDRLLEAWGRVVLRDGGEAHPFRVISVEPLLPDPFSPGRAEVVQATTSGQDPAGRAMLPALRRHQIRSMLQGAIEPRWRWVRAWRPIWSTPWV